MKKGTATSEFWLILLQWATVIGLAVAENGFNWEVSSDMKVMLLGLVGLNATYVGGRSFIKAAELKQKAAEVIAKVTKK